MGKRLYIADELTKKQLDTFDYLNGRLYEKVGLYFDEGDWKICELKRGETYGFVKKTKTTNKPIKVLSQDKIDLILN